MSNIFVAVASFTFTKPANEQQRGHPARSGHFIADSWSLIFPKPSSMVPRASKHQDKTNM
jgi:hypothetical protein